MAKHTEGPFEVGAYSDFPNEPGYRVFSKTTDGNVALFYSEADAELFAVAPKMLAALQTVLEHSNCAGAELSSLVLQGDTTHAVRDAKGAMRELQLLNEAVRAVLMQAGNR